MDTPATLCCDCAVIGAGPGGLAAAIYLARFNRQVLVFGEGTPRAAYSPRNRNYPGFPEGITGRELLEQFASQADRFQVQRMPYVVTELEREGDCFRVRAEELVVEARRVILATGLCDLWPDVENIQELAGSHVRVCPICDAYETNGKRVGIVGCGDKVAREALYLRCFAQEVVLFSNGLEEERPICAELMSRLDADGIRRYPGLIERMEPVDENALVVCLEDGSEVRCDLVFSALGVRVNSGLATALGAKADEDGYLETDRWQQTTVPGLYAVGDVTSSINQVTVAVGQAAVAATAVHNGLLDF
ncbi:MAG: NAD(P)/FAD-dependent oxidoreductase [Armatimonadota bacterium]